MIHKKDVDNMFAKINKGIWEYRKARAKDITKSVLTGIWTITVFPFLLVWMFLTDKK